MNGELGVEGGFDGESAALEDVSVDHCRFHVLVTEEFLDGTDVVTALQEVGGEGVAEDVRGDVFVNVCAAGGISDRFLYKRFMEVMTTGDTGPFVCGNVGGGKDVLPNPLFVCVLVFAL